MLPRLKTNNPLNGGFEYAVLAGQRFAANAAAFVSIANLNYFMIVKLCMLGCFSASGIKATLRKAVANIIAIRSKEKMIWITARLVVAFVAYANPVAFWYRAIRQFVSSAMRQSHLALVRKLAVTPFIDRHAPRPAFLPVSLFNSGPKSTFKSICPFSPFLPTCRMGFEDIEFAGWGFSFKHMCDYTHRNVYSQ